MNYVNAASRPKPAAILGALGVPGAFGLLLVIGLAVTATAPAPPEILDTWDIPDTPLPTPDPVVEPDKPQIVDTPMPPVPEPVATPPRRPDTAITFTGATTPINTLPGTADGFDEMIGTVAVPTITPPGPTFPPVGAMPRGNVGGWITDSDYRTPWINREYSGVAGFALSIDARGRVTDCSITRSTGHNVLDEATCRLLQRRARFDPAKDASGNAVAGTFTSSVNWKIPE